MIARVSTWQAPADEAQRARVKTYIEHEVIAGLRNVFGYRGGEWLLDPASGKLLVVTRWGSQAALDRSNELMARVLAGGESRGLRYVGAETYEVMLEG